MGTIRMYVGTEKGFFTLKSEDRQSWKVERHSLQDWEVPKFTTVESQPNRVVAGTRGDGVWLSEDFGQSWKKPCYGKRGPGKVRCVTVDPQDPETIYAGTEPIDIFVSHDAGKSWSRLDSVWKVPWVSSVNYVNGRVEPHVRDIAIDAADSNTIYAALQVGFMLKSTDRGTSWKLLNEGVDADVHTFVMDPKDSEHIYIATGGDYSRDGKAPGRALYETHDGGESWIPLAMNLVEEYSVPLVMHPNKPEILYSVVAKGSPGDWRRRSSGAESFIVRTRNGGKDWEKLDGKVSEVNREYAESLVIDGSQPNHLYAGLRNGSLYHSDDEGNSWKKLDVDLPSITDMRCSWA